MESAETFLNRARTSGEESLKPIKLPAGIVAYANVRENTQCSVYMQKDIETRTQQMKLGNGLNSHLEFSELYLKSFIITI